MSLLGPFLFIYWRNGVLLSRQPFANPYKWGFYLGYYYLIAVIFELLDYVSLDVSQIEWSIDEIWRSFVFIFDLMLAIGLTLRLRTGWWLFLLQFAVFPVMVLWSFLGEGDTQFASEGISLGFSAFGLGIYLTFVAMNVVYARVRWQEFWPKRVDKD